ncbi:MAG: YkgJ family cysteine cluster protein [Armatimonadetes bacterium]|nr:YkgJ family cysteine cluster protein [Armatimonadota bacterium]
MSVEPEEIRETSENASTAPPRDIQLLPPHGSKRPWKERLSSCDGCDKCGDRCISGYPISRWEYERICGYLNEQDPAERERVARQEKNVPWPGAPEFTYEACRFRDVERGRCSIYPVRPLVCRIFGHVEWLPCPEGIIEDVAPEGVTLMEWYARRDLRTFEEWQKFDGWLGR